MKLSDNFTLKEFTDSVTAINHGISNVPGAMHIASLRNLVTTVLQPSRDKLGMALFISSGYRSPALNQMIGGADNSQHTRGEAADVQCNDNAALFNYIRYNTNFDQLVWEFGSDDQPQWVHVSCRIANNRGEVLKATKENGKTVYNYL